MATLKELMGDKTRGDGRKFTNNLMSSHEWFEPIFLAQSELCGDDDYIWEGVDDLGFSDSYSDSCNIRDWQEWTPPKQTKKVKLYSPIYENLNNLGYYESHRYTSNKQDFLETAREKIVGWHEIEVEVDE